MPQSPYDDEPGKYRVAPTDHGFVVMVDHAKRLKDGGAPLPVANGEAWVIWHPRSNVARGYWNRQECSHAWNRLLQGQDEAGMWSEVLPPASSKHIDAPEKDGGEVKSDGEIAPAQARAASRDSMDYPADFMRALQSKFPPSVLMERLESNMTAETPFVVDGQVHMRPDWSIRLKAWENAVAYMIGRPIERQQILQANAPMSWDDLVGLADKSPVFRDTLMGMLRELERKHARTVEG